MAEAARSPFRGGEFPRLRRFQPREGLKDELGDPISALYRNRGGRGVEQPGDEFAPIVRIDHSHSLRHGQSLYRAQTAAGIDKASHAGLQRLDGDSGGYSRPLSRGDDKFIFGKAGPQIQTRRTGSGEVQSPAVQGAGVAKLQYLDLIHSLLLAVSAAEGDPGGVL